ncbi:MAG: adenosylcobinamide amidohydrolase [Candidatus Bathyarchaeota archaeon]|nr:adenosylcobinamide amidohydrolase [Candidatus Bathyarchaeota archaeon]
MNEIALVGNGIKLVVDENIIAVVSKNPLTATGSAIHNGGGLKQTRIIANTQVTAEYGDSHLHLDPEAFILQAVKKLGLNDAFMGMITFAMVKDFVVASKTSGDLGVSVIATAGCTHAESSGETITFQETTGTINIMVIIDGNPVDSGLVGTIITATEAKTAALQELDLRSRYSGQTATGTVTDAMVVAKTGRGERLDYGGPASDLGQLVGCCTRKAVKEAVRKAQIGGYPLNRTLLQRLDERHLSVEKMAQELSKIKRLGLTQNALRNLLTQSLENNPLFASAVLAAAKLDEDFQNGLVTPELGDASGLGKAFGGLLEKPGGDADSTPLVLTAAEAEMMDLSPFLKQALFGLVQSALSDKGNWKA